VIWFTADTHFGHRKIIKYANRPFNSVKEMDEALINNWNRVVKPHDTVYHLGDFSLATNVDKYFGRLLGMICVVPGSHDWKWTKRVRTFRSADRSYIKVLPPLITVTVELGQRTPIVLCHYAMRIWDKSHFNSWQLFGHSHGMLKTTGKQYDVGVDNNKFYPVSILDIQKIMAMKENNRNLVRKKQ